MYNMHFLVCQNLLETRVRHYRKLKGVPRSIPWIQKIPDYQTEVKDPSEQEEKLATGLFFYMF
jgi:hypothetical protein